MDIAVNLVESYLRINGYLTLSEVEVQGETGDGTYETITDIDVVGLRFPGSAFVSDPHDDPDCKLLLIEDEALLLEEDTIDLIIGEVKQGEAVFNPGLKRHEVLHSVLRRIEWIFAEPLGGALEELRHRGVVRIPARGGGFVRARLVAFGRSEENDMHTIRLTHVFNTMIKYLEEFADVLRPAQFKDPAPGLLQLLVKTGFTIERN